MNFQIDNVALVSLANDQEKQQLCSQLSNIGYSRITTVDNQNPFKQKFIRQCRDGIVVLQLKHVNRLKSRILDILNSYKPKQVLGLFQDTTSSWDHEIVNYCKEIASWPCSESELSLRIKRLFGKMHSPEQISRNIFVRLNILGESPAFYEVLHKAGKIATCDAPVYIDGETGTGKEIVARSIHYLGNRSDYPFVAANCGALPDSLIENEIFGHEKGAFTDAREAQQGLIAQAEGGTLLLDEIELLSAKGQAALLRFLQDYEYRPLGSHTVRKANVRIITAGNEPLDKLVKQKKFRQDLYYRLNILCLSLPPLRERRGDIEILARHFIHKFQHQYQLTSKELEPKTLQGMMNYDWPGNVRELENLLHREFLLSDEPEISIKSFVDMTSERRTNHYDRRNVQLFQRSLQEAKSSVISQFEAEYINYVMSQAGGNISEAARIAGKERRAFSRLLEKYMVDKSRFRN